MHRGKHGFPIFHEIFSGNFPQKKTLFQIAEKLKVFGRTGAVLVFDAGIEDIKTISDVEDMGFGVISRMPMHEGLKKLALENISDYETLEDAEKYDGIYVIYCSDISMPKEKAVKAYFERERIEKGFQTLKNVLNVKPLRFQLDKRLIQIINSHI